MTTENGVPFNMPVMPAYGGNGGGFGFGNGTDGWWILLLLMICGGGWGFGGFGGAGMMGAGMMGGMFGMDYLYPWLNNSQHISDGFRDQALQSSINGLQNSVTAGFGDVQNSLCGGFAGVNAAIANGFAQSEIANNTRQIANMQQGFAAQTATTQGFNGVQGGLADLKYTVATENCADRTAAAQNTRDIIDAQTRGTQAILDKLCALELDGVKGQLAQAQRENVGLQNQLNMATMRESQTAQNALFQQGLNNEVDALYNRLNNCPVPSVPVYGRQPIFTCNNNGCGCGAMA